MLCGRYVLQVRHETAPRTQKPHHQHACRCPGAADIRESRRTFRPDTFSLASHGRPRSSRAASRQCRGVSNMDGLDFPFTPKAAKAAGSKFYFSGKPCSQGHISPRYTSCHRCVACSKDHMVSLREQTRQRRAKRPLSPHEQAKADGRLRYTTGKPCPRGHYAERLTINGACVICAKEDRERRETTDPSIKTRRSIYRKDNAERYRTHVRNRRAKRKGSPGSYTQEDVLEILKSQRDRCAYCKKKLSAKWHVDHIMPIHLGGTNDRSNIQVTCERCNLEKSWKDPICFAQQRGLLL